MKNTVHNLALAAVILVATLASWPSMASSVTRTIGVWTGSDLMQTIFGARESALDKCEDLGGYSQGLSITSVNRVDFPDTAYNIGGKYWVVKVKCFCIIE